MLLSGMAEYAAEAKDVIRPTETCPGVGIAGWIVVRTDDLRDVTPTILLSIRQLGWATLILTAT